MATVADIMERDPIAVGRDDDVESVIRVLREHELPGVPVVDGSGKLVGIITENDLIKGARIVTAALVVEAMAGGTRTLSF